MYEGSRADDDLITALRDLDAAKALVRKTQLELSKAVPAPSQDDCSPSGTQTFEAKAREMNEATKHYLEAVDAFNAAAGRSKRTQATAVIG